MAEIKYQYAYDENGQIVSIKDYTKEESRLHSYRCLGCGKELLPRAIGSKSRKAHFYHKTLIDCSGETYLHKLGKLLIKSKFDGSDSFLVSYQVSEKCSKLDCALKNFRCEIDKKERIIDLKKIYDTCTEEVVIEDFVADLLLTNSQKPNIPPVLIEICVTHSCEDRKRSSGLKIIELTIKNEQDVVDFITEKILEEPLFQFDKKKKVEFISFNRNLKLPMEVAVSRYIFRAGLPENGYVTSVKCKDALYKSLKDSIVELNIVGDLYSDKVGIDVPLSWMSKNKNLRRCLICKFYYATIYENAPICRLSRKYGKPKYPEMIEAEQCRYFKINKDLFDYNLRNYNIEEVTNLPLELKDEYRVIIAGSSSFCDYVLFKKKCEYYLSAKMNSHKITVLCGTSTNTKSFINKYCYENSMNVEPYYAYWDKYGQDAAYRSNERMIKHADALIAFWDGESKVTCDLINLAKLNGLKVAVVKY